MNQPGTMDIFGGNSSNTSSTSKTKTRHPNKLPDLTNCNLSDDKFFSVMMQQEAFCKQILEIILDKKFTDLKFNSIQETLQNLPGYKSIRLDAYAEDAEGNRYNIEMQKLHNDNMPKRSRFYQSLLDTSSLPQGKTVKYNDMTKLYVIFITDFDVFDRGLCRYTFTNRCHEIPTLELGDDVTKIFLNLKGVNNNIPSGLQDLLHFIKDTRSDFMSQDSRMQTLVNLVKTLKGSEKVRTDTMNMNWVIEEAKEEAKEEGIKALINSLQRAGMDSNFILQQLQEEYNLTLEQAKSYMSENSSK